MSPLRRACAVAVMALVLLESAGIARALGEASWIECCCGKHSRARPCGCTSCPALRKRTPEGTGVSGLDSCGDHELQEAALLLVLSEPAEPQVALIHDLVRPLLPPLSTDVPAALPLTAPHPPS
jgi:hypothetical protein